MKKFFLSLIISLTALSLSAQQPADADNVQKTAKQQKRDSDRLKKKQKAEALAEKKAKAAADDLSMGKVEGKLYIFGCSTEFGDSVVYITSITEVDSIALSHKFKFLPYRADFSQQLKDKLEMGDRRLQYQTSAVFFSDKKAKLEKKYANLKKRWLKKGEVKIVSLPETEFKFVHPLDYNPVYE